MFDSSMIQGVAQYTVDNKNPSFWRYSFFKPVAFAAACKHKQYCTLGKTIKSVLEWTQSRKCQKTKLSKWKKHWSDLQQF